MKTITLRPFAAAKFTLFVVAGLFALAGCDGVGIRGNGNVTTENRAVTNFSQLEANGAFRIEWTAGAPSLSITTDQNLLGYIDATVTSGKLVLRSHDNLRPTRHLTVRVASTSLTAAALHGAVRLTASNISATNFYLDCEGATRVELVGHAAGLFASLSGASKLMASDFQTQTTELSISGAGKAEVYATEKLNASISGAGKVIYSGNPRSVEKRVSGAGSIKRRD